MQDIDLVFMTSLYSPNGASVLVRKIQGANSLFEHMGIRQRVIAPKEKKTDKNNRSNSKTARGQQIRSFIRYLSKWSAIVATLRLQGAIFIPSRKIIEQYDTITDKAPIVVFHEIYTCYEYLKKHKKKEQKVILVLHGSGEMLRFENYVETKLGKFIMRKWSRQLDGIVLKGCDKIGFDANLPRKHFCELYPYDENNTFFVYNGIEKRPMPTRKLYNKLKLICVATLSERKNQMGILNAIEMLPQDIQKKIELTLVGDGDVRTSLEKKAKHLAARIDFKGTATESDYYHYMLESNCFCLFSKSEGMPIAIIEGMRAGLPIIGSRVDGIPEEIVDGKTGFVVDLDEKALSERLRYLANNLDVLTNMGKASYDFFIENFTINAMIDKYVQIYKQ